MPLLAEFYGMKIFMYYEYHSHPHIHLQYSGEWYIIALNGDIISGSRLPVKISKLIKEWTFLHEAELYDNWDKAQTGRKLTKIDPLR